MISHLTQHNSPTPYPAYKATRDQAYPLLYPTTLSFPHSTPTVLVFFLSSTATLPPQDRCSCCSSAQLLVSRLSACSHPHVFQAFTQMSPPQVGMVHSIHNFPSEALPMPLTCFIFLYSAYRHHHLTYNILHFLFFKIYLEHKLDEGKDFFFVHYCISCT